MCSKSVVIENADPHVLIQHTRRSNSLFCHATHCNRELLEVKPSGRRIDQVEDALHLRPGSDEYPQSTAWSCVQDEEVLTCTVRAMDTSQGSRVDAIGVVCPAVHIH